MLERTTLAGTVDTPLSGSLELNEHYGCNLILQALEGWQTNMRDGR